MIDALVEKEQSYRQPFFKNGIEKANSEIPYWPHGCQRTCTLVVFAYFGIWKATKRLDPNSNISSPSPARIMHYTPLNLEIPDSIPCNRCHVEQRE